MSTLVTAFYAEMIVYAFENKQSSTELTTINNHTEVLGEEYVSDVTKTTSELNIALIN